MTVATRIREARKAAKLSQQQLGDAAGVSREAVSQWESGDTQPTLARVKKVAETLRCSSDWLIHGVGGGDMIGVAREDIEKAPVIGKVQAGEWVEAFERPHEDWYAIDSLVDDRYNGKPRFALEVHGSSMNRHYHAGDVIVCIRFADLGREPVSGDRVVVQRHQPNGLIEATVKEYVVDEKGGIWLWPRSTAPEFQQPYRLTPRASGRLEDGRQYGAAEMQEPYQSSDGFHEAYTDEFEIVALVIGSYRRE